MKLFVIISRCLPLALLAACVSPSMDARNAAPIDRDSPQHPANWYHQAVSNCTESVEYPVFDNNNRILGFERTTPSCTTSHICISKINGGQIPCPTGAQLLATKESYFQELDEQFARNLAALDQELEALNAPQVRTEHYPNGQIKAEIPFAGGKINGQSRHYHPNGQLSETIEWQNSELHGERIRYDEQGKEIRRTRHINGQEVKGA